ncbi:OmpA family protein [Chryseosolibacter indicus]|uniref:OmpA family protein n=1 Tax=Chryseosolibacter indicus TaxID=2782351 RepID=A0ABS5VM09_9BACT|nr:OmpA family protein [Chryseosolibacter indicus]MBT1702492.1 OmpA family protein [Chryseosolibacter indicus]
MRFTLLIGFVLLVSIANAQSSFMPKSLGPSVNSDYHEINPVISSDGKALYFVRVNHPENKFGSDDSEDIWYASRVSDSIWSTPSRIHELNIGRYNSVLSVSADGNTLLLNGIYNKKGNIWKKRGLSVSRKNGESWSSPEKLKVSKLSKKNRGMRSSASMSGDGKFILLSYSKAFNGNKNNLYYTRLKTSGRWSRPHKLKGVNSGANEEAPFLSVDGKTLFFSSDRAKKGNYNIYRATRTGNEMKKWSKPVVLSDTINSPGWESYFKTNNTGSWGYFSSTAKSGTNADLFQIKLFEENPVVVIEGTIRNSKTDAALVGHDASITVNGSKPDSLVIDNESGTYKIQLRLGQVYELKAVVDNYTSSATVIDVSKVKEFSKQNADLRITPLPYVLVKGKLLVQDTGKPLDSQFNPKITINNTVVDSLKTDIQQGTYEVKLNHGTSYQFKLQAAKHESVAKTVDLSSVNEYKEINADLFVLEEKMAIISGVVINSKTKSKIENLKNAKIVVEGFEAAVPEIDTLTGIYELRLPFKGSYVVSVVAPGFYPVFETIDLASASGNLKISKDLAVIPVEVGQSIKIKNIFFDAGKSVLKKESYAELERVADFLDNNKLIKIEIAGHTDNVGNATSNQKLSQGRAQAVADFIVSKGIDKSRVSAKGYGSNKPVASNKTAAGKAENRRVEFTILDN